MSVHVICAEHAMAQWAQFDAVIDARSEGEYALDHLPGACNWPSLNDDERIRVGTLYTQTGAFEAQRVGAALVAANVARHLLAHLQETPRTWRPLVYCWRGGKRSNALALILGQVGWKVHLIEGGYKAFRQAVVQDTAQRVQQLRFEVLCGPTGSGKTRLLHTLAEQGEQTLDLEGLACHRASVLGLVPGQVQPSQKAFETQLWDALRGLDPARVVYVEAESKKIGNLSVPDSLMAALRASACTRLAMALPDRVQLLLQDYDFFVRDPALFAQRLDRLRDLRGHAVVDDWVASAHAGQAPQVVAQLLALHYDPGYEGSTQRHFARYSDAPVLQVTAPHAQAMAQAAQTLRARHAA